MQIRSSGMNAVAELLPPPLPTIPLAPVDPHAAERRREHLLDALKSALGDANEHRLFRSGRLDGLFPSKLGDSGEAARQALAAGLLEHVRTDVKGKFIFEWVKAMPRAVGFVAEHDSPKAILRELKDVLGETRAGVPGWMEETKSELRTLSGLFEQRSTVLLNRLESLAGRVEAALRRAESMEPGPKLGRAVAPWADEALAYLDQRKSGGLGPCPLAELFQALREPLKELTIAEFHAGIRRLADVRAMRLLPSINRVQDPEYAVVYDGKLMQMVDR